MIDFNAKLPDTTGYTFLKDGSILNEDQLQQKLNDGSLTQVNVDPNENNFKRSVGQGARQFAGTVAGLGGLVGDITGNEALKNAGLDNARKQLNIANLYARDTDQIQNVHSVGDAVSYGVNAIGTQIPGLVAGVAMGGVGGLIGKKLATSALAGEIDSLVAQQSIQHGSELGFKLGLFGQGTAQSMGSIYPQAIQNNDPNAVRDSLVGGLIGGGLNFLGDNALLNTFKNPAQGASFLSRLGKNVGTDATAQGLAGLSQSVNERAFSNRDLTSPEAIHEYLNATAQGAIGGGAFGSLNSFRKGENTQSVEQPLIQENNPISSNELQSPLLLGNDKTNTPLLGMERNQLSTERNPSFSDLNTYIDSKPLLGNDSQLKLSNSENFKRISQDKPDLLNMAEEPFNEQKLLDSGMSRIEVSSIKQELKVQDLSTKDLGGYTVNDILTKDLSNFTPEEISSIKSKVSDIVDNYSDTKLSNKKIVNDFNNAIEARYKDSIENPNVDNQILKTNRETQSNINEKIVKSQEEMAKDPSLIDNENPLLSTLTPEEKIQNIVKGADNEGVVHMEDKSPEIVKNVENAQKDFTKEETMSSKDSNNVERINADITKETQLKNKGFTDKEFIDRINSSEVLKEAHRIDPKAMERVYKNNKEDINTLNNVAENIIKHKDIVFSENFHKQNKVNEDVTRGLPEKEKLHINKVFNQAKDALKNTNVNLKVIHSKDSPFQFRDIDGYYDPESHTVVLIGDKIGDTKEAVMSVLNHELLHAGIYKMVKGNDRALYESQMEQLAKNPELDQLAKQLEKESAESGNPLSRPASIEEALGKMAQSGDFRNLKGIDKFINYIKGLINKILGRDVVTNEDVQQYMARANEFLIHDDLAQSIDKNSIMTSHEYVNDMGNMPKDIMFSEKFSNKQTKEVNEALKSFAKHVQANEDLKSSSELKSFMDKISDSVSDSIKIVANQDNRYDLWNKIVKNLSSMREMVQKSPIAQALQNIYDMSDRLKGGLDQQLSESGKILQSKLKAVSDFDNKSVNNIMADFGLQGGVDKFGKPSGDGVRPSEQQIRDAIANYKDIDGKTIGNKQGAYELYQVRRAHADLLVHKELLPEIQNKLNFIERKIESSEIADRSIITKYKTALNELYNGKNYIDAINAIKNGEDYNINIAKFSEDYKQFYAKLEELSKSDVLDPAVQLEFNDKMAGILEDIGNANHLIDQNGYLPKDHSGKYTTQMSIKLPTGKFNADGTPEMQRVVFAVHATDSFLKRNQYKDSFAKSIEQLVQKGIIKDVNQIEVTKVDRGTAIDSNMSVNKFINQAERKGIAFTEQQLKELHAMESSFKIMQRSFKTGVGYSLDFDKTIFKQIRKNNNDISRGNYYNKEVNIIKNSEGWEKDLMMEMQNAKQQVNDTDAISAKLRGMASMWYLGWNASSALMQGMQMLQAAPSWMSQYSGGTGTAVTMMSLKKAARYLKDGTTGDKALDQAIKDFTSPLLGAGENELMFNLSKENEFNRKNDSKYGFLTKSYGLFSKAEELSRLTTFLSSHELFHNQDKYKSRVAVGDNFHEFATNNLIKVNGDYSAYNRPKAFQGPVAQTLFQFKQYLVFMNEMFQHMDNKAKGQFIATMVISGGLNGLPFAKNVEDGIDFLLKIFHIPFSVRGYIDSHLKDMGKSMGSDSFSTYIQNGIVPSIGVRAGLGDIVPFMGPILDIAGGGDVGKALQSSVGPVGSVTVNTAKGLGKLADSSKDLVNGDFSLLSSDMSSAIKQLAPNAFKNIIKGGESALEGYNINTAGTGAGRKTDLFDSVTQMFGFQTVSAISANDNQNIINEAKDLKKNISSYYKNQYLTAKMSGNDAVAREIISNIREHNRMAKIDKSGYDFNADIGSWNKDARMNNTLDSNVRAIKGTSQSMRKALADDLNININTNNNLTQI